MVLNTRFFSVLATAAFACIIGSTAFAQQGSSKGLVQSIERNSIDGTPKTIVLGENSKWGVKETNKFFNEFLGVDGAKTTMQLKYSTTTKMDITTERYIQFYKGLKVVHGDFSLVSKAGKVSYAQGNFYDIKSELSTAPGITEGIALGYALEYVGAEKYMWQIPAMEARIKRFYHKTDTSYTPHGHLVWIEDLKNVGQGDRHLHLAWEFDVYAQKPLSRQLIYVDATTGKILHTNSLLKHTSATSRTLYSGTVPFKTANTGSGYILYDSTRGGGVYTMNGNYDSTTASATDYTSATNTWPTSTADTQAIDAHWGAEIVYDYWKLVQGRRSWDDADGILMSYVHIKDGTAAMNNAFWDGAEMNYGDGTGLSSGGFRPLVSLDVAAHEIGHGICQATANLDYNRESGAMNEAFSDCWAATIENYGNPHETDAIAKQTWKIGEEIAGGSPLRSMDNPLLQHDPATYGGTYWRDPSTTACATPSSSNDECYVHTNSGVLNHWYYFVVMGGSGTNDLGTTYSVSGIGFSEAANILYQTELALSNTADYAACRVASINAATLLYGSCSRECQAVTDAWHAVGVGAGFTPCTPQIGFVNPHLTISEYTSSTACPASRTINVGMRAFGTAITGGSPTVSVYAAGGTAVSGVDYSLSSTSMTFTPGDTSVHNAVLTWFDNGVVHDSKTLILAFTLTTGGSTTTIAATNDTMFLNINNDDSVPMAGGVEYHTLNVGTAVTSNTTSAFAGIGKRGHPEYLLTAAELTAAGVRPGVPISQIAFNITTKNSTAAFINYAVGMLNTSVTDLTGGYVNTSMVYYGNHTTRVGTDSIDFSSNFVWDGISNVAVEMCYGPNSTNYTGNDQMSGVQGTVDVTLVNTATSGTTSGCNLDESTATLSTARPIMRFKQVVPPANIETALSSTRTWDVKANTEVYFYNPTDSLLIAGLDSPNNNLGCVTATLTGAGNGFTPATFSTGNRSLKELTITPTTSGATTTYKATMYMTNTEMASTAASSLYLLKTTATTDAGINATNTITIAPTVLTGSTYVAFTGSFTGFGRYMLVDRVYCPFPIVGAITGTTSLCTGGTTTLSDTTVGGTWTSSSTGVATISSSGVVTAVGTGTTTISYAKTNSCGTTYATATVNIVSSPSAGTISGATGVCTGATTTLSTTGTGGTWSSVFPAFATVSATGVVTGVAPGVDTIKYTVTTTCGTAIARYVVTVSASPTAGIISGPSTVCTGATASLATTGTGGTWSSSATGTATVSASGVVTGVASGSVIISYSVTNSCGTAVDTQAMVVSTTASAGSISGASSVCTGSTITLSETMTGGAWSSSNTALATVTSGGVVTGVTAGSVTISYAVTTSCGTAYATYPVTVNATPNAGTISGATTGCTGSTIGLTETATGGTWSSSNTSIATVNASGVVTAVATGSVTISYTVTTACGTATATHAMTIGTGGGSVSAITGPTSVCVGSTITLSDATSGGTWSSGSTANATVSASGVVTGVSGGAATISYGVTSACGTTYATYNITVNALPTTGTISGSATVCLSGTTTLTETISGGTWSSSTPSVATINSSGVVSGVSVGSSTISYAVTNVCGTGYATFAISTVTSPTVSAITGGTTTCVGTSVALSDATSGGTWSSGSTSVATVDGAGNVYGVAVGTAIISYTVTNACGSNYATRSVNVISSPSVASISGPSTACTGTTITLTDATTGGTWSSSTTSVATISSTGVVTPVAAGSTIITYSLATSCGTAAVIHTVNVYETPAPAAISGASGVCQGSSITLTDASTGGVWTSSTASVATITSGGVVTGLSSGTTTITYSITNVCGSAYVTHSVTVTALPVAGSISGPSSVCQRASISLTASVSGGTWGTSSASIATVDAGGVVTGVSGGMANIIYTMTNVCGSISNAKTVTVYALPTTGTITGPTALCSGSTDTMRGSVSGGVWMASNGHATVTLGGVITAVSAGIDTIYHIFSNSCGPDSAMLAVSIETGFSSGALGALDTVCLGDTLTLTAPAPGGAWMALGSNASVDAIGQVVGLHVGRDTIVYSVANTCGSSIAILPVVVSNSGACAAGVTNRIASDNIFDIYPNPNNGTFTIHFSTVSKSDVSVVITDAIGKKVAERIITANKYESIELNVASGIYYVTAVSENGKVTRKLVVE